MGLVKELSEDFVPNVDAFLRKDPFINAYALWDLYYFRYRTKFFIYVEDNEIKGLLLDYQNYAGFHSIWLFGNEKVVDDLLNVPLSDKMVFHVPLELESLIKQRFSITSKYLVDFMLLPKGNEKSYLTHKVKKLRLEDAYSFASLEEEKPNEETIEKVKTFIKELPFYGIFVNSELVSVACIEVRLPEIWIIGGFYTKKEHRNKGYATSLASFFVKEALNETNHVGLYVRADNYPAKRVYEKVGFTVYKRICWLDYKTGIIP